MWAPSLFLSALLFFVVPSALADTMTVWKGGNGGWNQSSNWTNGVPNNTTDVLIDGSKPPSSTVTLQGQGAAANLTIDGPSLPWAAPDVLAIGGKGTLSVDETLNNSGARFATDASTLNVVGALK